MGGVLTAILTKVAASVAVAAAKAAYAKLTDAPHFAKAISSTEESFHGLIVRPALQKWCDSDSFKQLLSELEDGKRNLVTQK